MTETPPPEKKKPCPCKGSKAQAPTEKPCCDGCARHQLAHVEAHFGAAWAMLRMPAFEGRRPLVVGHLFLAECDSTPWPNLAKSLSAARNRYQERGQLPDFAALCGILLHCRRQLDVATAEKTAEDVGAVGAIVDERT